MHTCAICRYRFEAESPAVLFISAYGAKRVLCESCEALLDKATAPEESAEREEARASLETLANKMKDPEAFEALAEILSGTTADENDPTPEEEAEMEAMFEEIRREEEAAPKEETKSPLLDYIFPIAFVVALVGIAIWFFFFR